MEDNLRDFAISWRFFDALRGDGECGLEQDEQRQLLRFGRKLTDSEAGCFKSHLAVLAEFDVNRELEWLLVLEDDVWVDTLFDYSGAVALAQRHNINYLRLYARRWKPADVVEQWNERQLIRFRTDPYGTQGYLINRAGASGFRRSIQSIDMPIDDEYGRFWRNGLEIFAVFPFPIIERATASTLQAGRASQMPPKAGLGRYGKRVQDYVQKAGANLGFRLGRRRSKA